MAPVQQPNVKLSPFGRLLHGLADQLVGFEQSLVEIEDPQVVATSGRTHHPIVKYNGRDDSRVSGTVFEITDAELEMADRYEVGAYKRVAATLASGTSAWVYVDARLYNDRIRTFAGARSDMKTPSGIRAARAS